ncbi:MAG: UpxY family transcription antiterminator [Prevotellaceae bacterium]|jgi:transcription antitermination factor NusG|nr:UpxY family transcription antiterminator [Prevotellaceae bacterium]
MNWYAAKIKSHTERKLKKWLAEREVEHFIPFHNVVIERNGRRFRKEKPWISGLIFIRAEQQDALKIQQESIVKMFFLMKKETKTPRIIPNKQMQDFMFMLDFSDTTIKIDNTNFKQGDRVRVIKGGFAGIEGELIRIKGHKRVVVRLEGLFSLATTYIPPSFLEKI